MAVGGVVLPVRGVDDDDDDSAVGAAALLTDEFHEGDDVDVDGVVNLDDNVPDDEEEGVEVEQAMPSALNDDYDEAFEEEEEEEEGPPTQLHVYGVETNEEEDDEDDEDDEDVSYGPNDELDDDDDELEDEVSTGTPTQSNTAREAELREQQRRRRRRRQRKKEQKRELRQQKKQQHEDRRGRQTDVEAASAMAVATASPSSSHSNSWFQGTLMSMGLLDHKPALSFSPTEDSGDVNASPNDSQPRRNQYEQASPESLILSSVTSSLRNPISAEVAAAATATAARSVDAPDATSSSSNVVAASSSSAEVVAMSLQELQESNRKFTARTEQMREEFAKQLATLQDQLQQTNELLRSSKPPPAPAPVPNPSHQQPPEEDPKEPQPMGQAVVSPPGVVAFVSDEEDKDEGEEDDDDDNGDGDDELSEDGADADTSSDEDHDEEELVQANQGRGTDRRGLPGHAVDPQPPVVDTKRTLVATRAVDSTAEDDKKQDDDDDWILSMSTPMNSASRDAVDPGPTPDVDSSAAALWFQNELRHRDIAQLQTNRLLEQSQGVIHDLRNQMLEYAEQVRHLSEQLKHQQDSAVERDELRSQEAEDLRVLNDAVEAELADLRLKLEEAVQEAEVREAEVSRHYGDLRMAERRIGELEVQLGEAETRLTSRGDVASPDQNPASPLVRMAPLRLYDDDNNYRSLDNDKINDQRNVQELKDQLAASEKRTRDALAQLEQAQTMLQASEASKQQAISSFQSQMVQFQQAAAHSEAVLRDQLADMEVELAGLRLQTTKSGDSFMTRSSPRASSGLDVGTKGSEHPDDEAQSRASRDLESSSSTVLLALQELQSRLEDRDATISALVKSSASLEQQLASAKLEADALRSKFTPAGGHDESVGLDVIVAESASMERVSELERAVELLSEKEKNWLRDVDRLQSELRDSKVELSQLKTRLEATKSENLLLKTQLDQADTGSDGGSMTNSSVISSSLHAQIQERDCAIANLVQQSIEQDRVVTELRKKLASLQQETEAPKTTSRELGDVSLRKSDASSRGQQMTWEEIQELRRETEMFAGQVIEQDEEIEALTKTLKAKDQQLASQERELEALRKSKTRAADSTVIDRLNGEIDELTEANNVLRDEVRMLRRKSKDMESSAEVIDRLKKEVQDKAKEAEEFKVAADNHFKEKSDLTRELEVLRVSGGAELKQELERIRTESAATVKNLEARLRESDRTIVSLRAASSLARSATMDELELENLRSEVLSLQRNLQHQIAAVDSAKNTIRELEQMLAQRNANEAAAWEEEKEELLAEVEALTSQLNEARSELRKVEEQRCIIEDFKAKLEDADEAREASEKSIVDTYERKLSLLTLDKDVTIDKLRKELAETKASCDDKLGVHLREIDMGKERLAQASDHMAYEIQDREARIFALERTLEAQEQLVNNMKSEMDILQGSMENKAVTRREELEVMQQELVDLTTLAAQQERDIRSLQGKLQDQKFDYDSQIAKLKETIALMESDEQADHRTAADLKMEMRVREVKDRLEKLKWRNTSLSEENELLRERLIRAENASARDKSSDDETKELQRLLAERDLKMQILEAELKELKYSAQAVAPPPPPPPPTYDESPEPPSPKTSALCKSPLRSSTSSSSKPPTSSRRLGFLGRRPSSARRATQAS